MLLVEGAYRIRYDLRAVPGDQLLHAGIADEGILGGKLARVTLARAALVQRFAGRVHGFESDLWH